jgi:hypothetical protein
MFALCQSLISHNGRECNSSLMPLAKTNTTFYSILFPLIFTELLSYTIHSRSLLKIILDNFPKCKLYLNDWNFLTMQLSSLAQCNLVNCKCITIYGGDTIHLLNCKSILVFTKRVISYDSSSISFADEIREFTDYIFTKTTITNL